MADPETGVTEWYASDPRAIVPLDGSFHVPKRLARRVRSGRFRVTSDRAFGAVLRACADPSRDGAWINSDIIDLFDELHELGHAHSFEAWFDINRTDVDHHEAPACAEFDGSARVLVGGLYGVAIGGFFSGEAMFSRPDLGGTDASKVALVRCVEHLRACGFSLFDAQFSNPHLEQFGVLEIRSGDYLQRLARAVALASHWRPFERGTPS